MLIRRGLTCLLLVGCGPTKDDGAAESDGSEGGESSDSSGSSDTAPQEHDYPVPCEQLVAGGATVGGGTPGLLGFPAACSPREQANFEGGEYKCCSDDPATLQGGLPEYLNAGIQGETPIFAGVNNDLGTWGMCIRTVDIPRGSGLFEPEALDCPIPCNPTWDATSIDQVCGPSRVCCQTVELQPEDCIQDSEGIWRPASGEDVLAGRTDWAPGRHATHQDPNGSGCMTFTGDIQGEDFALCVEALSTANQRGYCMALSPGQLCADQDPSYVDACEAMNG